MSSPALGACVGEYEPSLSTWSVASSASNRRIIARSHAPSADGDAPVAVVAALHTTLLGPRQVRDPSTAVLQPLCDL
jgi:hypothetical protein